MKEAREMFDYYLNLLSTIPVVADYIANENNGFQELRTLLGPSRINHVFVYGTLLSHVRPASWDKGLPGPPETGWIWGKLYQVGEYPGALLSSPPTDMEPERAQEKSSYVSSAVNVESAS
jgi:hypothetical protein